MLQQDQPDDYVVATGDAHSVRELVEIAFGHVGLDWQKYVRIDPRVPPPGRGRPPDRRRRRRRSAMLGWTPTVDFQGLVEMMVDADLERLRMIAAPAARAHALRRRLLALP